MKKFDDFVSNLEILQKAEQEDLKVDQYEEVLSKI